MNENRCRHFSGTVIRAQCAKGIDLSSIEKETNSCRGIEVTCTSYSSYTKEELKQLEADSLRRTELIRSGLSPCCEAPIDEKNVIKEGRHAGHGPRLCSKCHKVVFWV